MTPDQITLVQSTFTTVTADADLRLAKRFYEHLFRISPESRSLFSTDPAVQRQKFTDELGEACTDEVTAAWRAAYDLVAEAMMMGAAPVRNHR